LFEAKVLGFTTEMRKAVAIYRGIAAHVISTTREQ
jgi:hypothetical protein